MFALIDDVARGFLGKDGGNCIKDFHLDGWRPIDR
jgi:hypothetical protein